MRYAIITALLYICFTQSIHSSDHNIENKQHTEVERFADGRKYICYEFGFCKSIQIYIAEGDTICDVVICDDNNPCVSTTCKKTSLLQWAFAEMAIELKKSRYKFDDNYKPYYYKLSLQQDSCRIVAASSTSEIEGNDILKDRLEMLKTFMIEFWYSNCIK